MFSGDALLVEGVEAVDFVFFVANLRVERELKLFSDMMAFPDDGTLKFSRFGADCVEART